MPGTFDGMPLRDRLRMALTTAMKERDTVALAALRPTLGAIDNAEAVEPPATFVTGSSPVAGAVRGLGASEVARRDLTEEEITGIVRAEIAERRSTADDYESAGQAERAARLRAEGRLLATQLKTGQPI